VTDALFAILHEAFGPDAPRRVGVAVSGGGDSMALLVALIEAGFAPEAVTVNHGLRPEAASEAAFVARFCAERGITHAVLHWDGRKAEGNLMDAARRARLSLIGDWARARGIAQVVLGHTADDQAETFLMRLAREAGLEGLAGMRAQFAAEGVLWLRPLLRVSRADLRAYLMARGVGWIEDPSNANARFDRVKARQALQALAPLGIGGANLGHVIDHLARAEQALGGVLTRLAEAHVHTSCGDVVIAAEAFDQAFEPELQRRLINAALMWVSGAEYPPRAAKVMYFLATWRKRRDRTLHGCRITTTDSEIRVTREAAAVAALRVPIAQIWDRWQIEGPQTGGIDIAALGAEGLGAVKNWRATGLPRASLLASPAIWCGETLVAAPLAGLENGFRARIVRPSFTLSLIRR